MAVKTPNLPDDFEKAGLPVPEGSALLAYIEERVAAPSCESIRNERFFAAWCERVLVDNHLTLDDVRGYAEKFFQGSAYDESERSLGRVQGHNLN